MKNEYRYQLDRGSKKFNCPECRKRKFVRYVDSRTSDYLPIKYGRCDRESKCSYHLNPYIDGYHREKSKIIESYIPQQAKKRKPKEIYYIPQQVLISTLEYYEKNIFIQNLFSKIPFPFLTSDIEKVIALYYLGTIAKGYCKGAITFPFIDKNNNVRAIQAKLFDKQNHTIKTSFLHSILAYRYRQLDQTQPDWLTKYEKNELKVSCLFGEHLLDKYPNNPIALVEAPKSAIYGTLYFGFPSSEKSLLWLAVYNLSSLNVNKCKVLQGRDIFLFPDLSIGSTAFNLWQNKAKELNKQIKGSCFQVSTLLERHSTKENKAQGLDIADFLIQHDWRLYRENSE